MVVGLTRSQIISRCLSGSYMNPKYNFASSIIHLIELINPLDGHAHKVLYFPTTDAAALTEVAIALQD
jgi:hypothetical protein